MNDLLDDIGNKLIADGLANGDSGWKLYKSYMAPAPNKIVAIFELPGPEPDQTPGTAYEFPAFQIFVRGEEFGYEEARTHIKKIYNSLNNADLSGYVYIYAADSGPLLDFYDREDNRPTLFWSFRTMKGPNPMIVAGAGGMDAAPSNPDAVDSGGNFSITVPSAQMGAVGQI